jgi:hypothetical protein
MRHAFPGTAAREIVTRLPMSWVRSSLVVCDHVRDVRQTWPAVMLSQLRCLFIPASETSRRFWGLRIQLGPFRYCACSSNRICHFLRNSSSSKKWKVHSKAKIKLSLYLTKHHAMKTYLGSGCIAPRILNFGTWWRCVASFTPWSLYPLGKSLPLRYPLDKKLVVWAPRSGLDGVAKRKNPHHCFLGKVKVKLCLWFNWAPRYEGVLVEWRYRSTHSLTSALDGEWSASRSVPSLPRSFSS